MLSCIPGKQKEMKYKDFVAGAGSAPKRKQFVGGGSEHEGGRSISNASALEHQAANLAPLARNALSTDDQLYLEKHFRRQIISQLGSATGTQVTAAADLMADIILRRPEGQTTEWHEAMRIFTERLVQRLNEGSG
ncbi:hypothetical protein BTUL_0009g00510 [Botrytis tulipae]|uniref:Uncharacterized protein n=1 Tax=Botrytis tulipae TaxID=87230 RepID=A0A4Z1F6H9_9HELO|nr:hypothetical protein BTUL_0009g00510 [Botrytis tulipae]